MDDTGVLCDGGRMPQSVGSRMAFLSSRPSSNLISRSQ